MKENQIKLDSEVNKIIQDGKDFNQKKAQEEEDKKSPSSKTKLIGPAAKGKRKKS